MLTPEEHERARLIFLAASNLPANDRAQYLEAVCPDDTQLRSEVQSLLNHAEAEATFLGCPALGEAFNVLDASPEGVPTAAPHLIGEGNETVARPERIGPYRIIDVVGRGGMGVVYRAEQDNPRRTVALKVIRPGSDSAEMRRRFAREAQVLAWLQHPGIAQIYAAGTAHTSLGYQPYFALEFVDGESLTAYVHDRSLDHRRRLELLARVCDAVHHAHQKGVIHRDLKPGNILVDNTGQPKILDFGVARLTDADLRLTTLQTTAGQLIGTLAYMSPEQIDGDPQHLDIRADVYALGVMLYELLTGKMPIDINQMSLPAAARTLAERQPTPMRQCNRALDSDLETIAGKALDKQKEQRYPSAQALAADIRAYLSHQPIAARPATTIYQLRKFARRHLPLVATIVFAVVAQACGLVYLEYQRNRAARAERLAAARLVDVQAEAQRVDAINRFYSRMLLAANPERSGRDIRVVDVLERAAHDVPREFEKQPLLEATLHDTIGQVYIGLGLYNDAEAFLRRALAARTGYLGQTDVHTLATATNLGAVLEKLGRWEEAETLLRDTCAARLKVLGPDHEDTLRARNNLAQILYRLGRIEEARDLWTETLAAQRRVFSNDDPQALATMNNLAQALRHTGEQQAAEQLLRELVELRSANDGEPHPHTLAAMVNLASVLSARGALAEAEQILRRVVALRRESLGDHPDLLSAMNNLGQVVREQGRLADAAEVAQAVREGYQQLLGPTHYRTLIAQNNLASIWLELGQAERANQAYESLCAQARTVFPDGHHAPLIFRRNHGACLTALGRYEDAEDALLPSYDGLRSILGPTHKHTQKARDDIRTLYDAWGTPDRLAAWESAESSGEKATTQLSRPEETP